jgi:hypothetical protein
MEHTLKYKKIGSHKRPNAWVLGPDTDIITQDKYYGWQKHRAQAKFRQEDYSLTWKEWQSLWPTELWLGRGRGKHDLCLMQIDRDGGWHIHNVEVVERIVYLQRAAEYLEHNNAKS